VIAAVFLLSAQSWAGEWPPQELHNLQVLPEDTTVRELVETMREFAGALGVRCTHCHVGEDSNDLTSIEFASDAKIEKRKARAMIRMVKHINGELLPEVPERSDPPVEVTCRTCHHSVTRPVDIRDLLTDAFRADGPDSAIALYRELREDYYGSDSYDFRPFMLTNVAERVARKNPQGAIQLLEFNGSLHPDSGQTFATMAQVYRLQGDIDNAVRSMERAVAAEPGAEWYHQALDRLRKQQQANENDEPTTAGIEEKKP